MNQTVIAEETIRSGVSPANKGIFSSRFHLVYDRLMAESPSLLYLPQIQKHNTERASNLIHQVHWSAR